MAGRVVSFWLPDELVQRLDEVAQRAGVPRNRWVARELEVAASRVDDSADADGR